jgi:hypothetical protein
MLSSNSDSPWHLQLHGEPATARSVSNSSQHINTSTKESCLWPFVTLKLWTACCVPGMMMHVGLADMMHVGLADTGQCALTCFALFCA